jgi:hypothetical protein
MDKGLAGVVVPTLWLVFMAAIPYIDRSREGIGLWFTNEVGKKCFYFSMVFTTVVVGALIPVSTCFVKIDRRAIDPVTQQRVGDGWPGYSLFATAILPWRERAHPELRNPRSSPCWRSPCSWSSYARSLRAGTREWMIAIWTASSSATFVLTVVGTSMARPRNGYLIRRGRFRRHNQCFEADALT